MQPKRSEGETESTARAAIRAATGSGPAGLAEVQAGFIENTATLSRANAASASSAAAGIGAATQAAAADTEPLAIWLTLCSRMVERRVELMGQLARCSGPVEVSDTLTRWTTQRVDEAMSDQARLMEAIFTRWSAGLNGMMPKR